jgi:hypothetical protein
MKRKEKNSEKRFIAFFRRIRLGEHFSRKEM